MSDVKILEQRAMEIRNRYKELEIKRDGQSWDAKKMARGFKKDVEDLIDILESKKIDERKLSHELADCLWSVLVIARKVDVDIERAFWTTMGELDQRFEEGGA
ncbi:MAG TPA: MazG nucleotide pyrophosphohydrolase domain-containing protein [Candidatus Saccharimonadales bacterium]|nr:MazG nucleotide pyrophosphohydrolase domain-containing protein [Candidatus Saccharimonadales bacterium]